MPPPARTLSLPGIAAIAAVLATPPLTTGGLRAQGIGDVERLSDIEAVSVRVEAQWDELITVQAGGATESQFLEALGVTLREAITGGEPAPRLVDGAPVTVTCHVDTFYDTGLIVYSLRVQAEEPVDGDDRAITWIRSSVGSYTVQQLHLMFRLGERCADTFLEAWREAR